MVAYDGVSHKSSLTEPKLSVVRNQAPCRVREFHIIGGINGKPRTLKINNASIDTLSAALLERMYFCKVDDKFVTPPVTSKTHIYATLKNFRNMLIKKIGKVDAKLTPEQFVSMFRGRKAAIYAAAMIKHHETGVLKRHATSIAFVKCEKVNPNKAPRCIQPRDAVYNIGVGCYLKHIEHRIYLAIARVFNDKDVVIKGFDVHEIGNIVNRKWQHFNRPVALGLDAVKFDMHVSAEMLSWEHSIYKILYDNDKELVRLLSYQINNQGRGYCDDGKLKYSVLGRRFSGDMNTALGNCIIMCAMVWSYAQMKGIDIKFINNGDDCVVFMEQENLDTFTTGLDEWFFQMGFRMTVEPPVYELERIEFCQMHPIPVTNGVVMVRNIDTAREKDSICLVPLPNATAMRKWLWAIGECGLALCSGIPIMQSMYMCYMRNGIESNTASAVQLQSGAAMLRKSLLSKQSNISDEARVGVFSAWGYTPDEQIDLEHYYDNLSLEYTNTRDDNFHNIQYSPY